MNCIQELEAQNLQDSWSILYFGLAEYLLNQSEQGEELVRSAVRTYGELVGNREREQQRKKGIKKYDVQGNLIQSGSYAFKAGGHLGADKGCLRCRPPVWDCVGLHPSVLCEAGRRVFKGTASRMHSHRLPQRL